MVRTPFGTHPFASAAINVDEAGLRVLADAARKAAKGDASEMDSYLSASLVPSHEQYLEGVGIAKILELLT